MALLLRTSFMPGVFMKDRLSYSPLDVSDLAEGAQGTNESMEPASPLKTTTVPVVSSEHTIKGPSAETGIVSQVGVEVEGRDEGDSQDASLTTDETKPAPRSEAVPNTSSGLRPTVLIIEDTTELAEVIQATLERMNIVTAHETHGVKALAKFNEMKPDVVLLDISLPDMTGWKILDTIKEKQEKGEMHTLPAIIVITAYGDPANRLVGKLQGVFSYLVKPFTADEVESVVAQALGRAAQ
jgi:CheY-like chemotaxis protein